MMQLRLHRRERRSGTDLQHRRKRWAVPEDVQHHTRQRRFLAALGSLPIAAYLVIAGLGVAGATVGTFAVGATDQPDFCGRCHEMKPFYAAWKAGPHEDVTCVACHVDPGTVSHLTHKAIAMKEVFSHLRGNAKFPLPGVQVPDSRCLACHKNLPSSRKARFAHAPHKKKQTCVDCHGPVGHEVTQFALARSGLLAAKTRLGPKLSQPTPGPAGHKALICFNCHKAAKTACATCHEPKHPKRGPCEQCHKPGAKFVFTHPAAAQCDLCHKKPPRHVSIPATVKCGDCHRNGGTNWSASHPAAKADCAACHRKPARHVRTVGKGTCATCHDPGKTWRFRHPSRRDCAACHRTPSGHFKGTCANCHSPSTAFASTTVDHSALGGSCLDCHKKPVRHIKTASNCTRCHAAGVSWSFRHPTGTGYCTRCHKKPVRHIKTSSSCPRCHTTGVSWGFGHPSSRASCTSCHKRPARHVATRLKCSRCHSTGASWRFSHPSSRASCTSCHSRPAGHVSTSASCSRCHATGVSWRYRHSSSRDCASCHSPRGHGYRPWCSYCHSPSVPFSRARFTHPSLREHTWRSFPCARCHRSSYASASCTACHGPGGPGD